MCCWPFLVSNGSPFKIVFLLCDDVSRQGTPFFHDNCENYNGETDKHTFISERVFGVGLNYDDVCAAHCTINSKHDISRPEMLMNYQEHKCYMLEPLFITPDGLILCRSDKVSNRISKLTHPF